MRLVNVGFLDRFRKKKVEEEKEEVEEMTDLEKICMDDKEVYEVLRGTMFLDPRKAGASMEDSEKKSEEL